MKKILAILLLLAVASWTVYLYGHMDSSEANSAAEVAYEPDARLAEMVQDLDTLKTSLRSRIELWEHDQKKQAAASRAGKESLPGSLRDPFSVIP